MRQCTFRRARATAILGRHRDRSDDNNNMAAEQPGRGLFIATKKDHEQRAELRDSPPPRGRIPETITARERMDRKLRTKRGRAI